MPNFPHRSNGGPIRYLIIIENRSLIVESVTVDMSMLERWLGACAITLPARDRE